MNSHLHSQLPLNQFFQIFLNLVEIFAISICSVIISIVTRTASSKEAENNINENIEEEWFKNRVQCHNTINIIPCTEFFTDVDFLHPFI